MGRSKREGISLLTSRGLTKLRAAILVTARGTSQKGCACSSDGELLVNVTKAFPPLLGPPPPGYTRAPSSSLPHTVPGKPPIATGLGSPFGTHHAHSMPPLAARFNSSFGVRHKDKPLPAARLNPPFGAYHKQTRHDVPAPRPAMPSAPTSPLGSHEARGKPVLPRSSMPAFPKLPFTFEGNHTAGRLPGEPATAMEPAGRRNGTRLAALDVSDPEIQGGGDSGGVPLGWIAGTFLVSFGSVCLVLQRYHLTKVSLGQAMYKIPTPTSRVISGNAV